ncbi:hypothetical protein [Mycobacterium sp.]|uniref:hypothetical protein n=1 Tax=Mycobacterium sp. TaxID=1785 RepID=UPI003BB79783
MKITKAAAGFAIAAAAAFAPALLLTAPVASAEPCLGAVGDTISNNAGNQACLDCLYAHPTANVCYPAPFVGGPAEGRLGGALGVG